MGLIVKENWFKVTILGILVLFLVTLRQHYRAECISDLTAQDGKSIDISRLSEACESLGYK